MGLVYENLNFTPGKCYISKFGNIPVTIECEKGKYFAKVDEDIVRSANTLDRGLSKPWGTKPKHPPETPLSSLPRRQNGICTIT